MAEQKKRGPLYCLLGCGCGCLVAIGAVIALGGVGVVGAMAAFRNSEAFERAVEMASGDSRVIEALGEPIRPGWFMQGSIHVDGGSGAADLQIPLSGPRGKATLYVVARRSAGEWIFDDVAVRLPSGERVQLAGSPAGIEDEATLEGPIVQRLPGLSHDAVWLPWVRDVRALGLLAAPS